MWRTESLTLTGQTCRNDFAYKYSAYIDRKRKRKPETSEKPKQIVFQLFIFLLIIILFFTVFVQQFIIT